MSYNSNKFLSQLTDDDKLNPSNKFLERNNAMYKSATLFMTKLLYYFTEAQTGSSKTYDNDHGDIAVVNDDGINDNGINDNNRFGIMENGVINIYILGDHYGKPFYNIYKIAKHVDYLTILHKITFKVEQIMDMRHSLMTGEPFRQPEVTSNNDNKFILLNNNNELLITVFYHYRDYSKRQYGQLTIKVYDRDHDRVLVFEDTHEDLSFRVVYPTTLSSMRVYIKLDVINKLYNVWGHWNVTQDMLTTLYHQVVDQ